jgi:excinuclease ABC subunit A
MAEQILAWEPGTRFSVLAPLARQRTGDLQAELERLRKEGFVRVRIDGDRFDLGDEVSVDPSRPHDLDVYVDRLSTKTGVRQRLTEALELATTLGEGRVRIVPADADELLWSERLACAACDRVLPELGPASFSFNSPAGACPRCAGLGTVRRFSTELVVPDPERSLSEGAIEPWGKPGGAFYKRMLGELRKHAKVDAEVPFKSLQEKTRRLLLEGGGGFEGVLPSLERRLEEYARRKRGEGADEAQTFELLEQELGRFSRHDVCPECEGARLRPESLAVTVGGESIASLAGRTVADLDTAMASLGLEGNQGAIADRILQEIRARARFLVDVGLEYLSLDRSAGTLSGGEGERIRLATQIGSALVGVLYVLDEPSIGLHPRDNARLMETLLRLRDRGNTVLVVEHDADTIRAADYVVDMGPGAGRHGGNVVAAGSPKEVESAPASVTGSFLSGARSIGTPQRRRQASGSLRIRGASANNLKDLDVDIPLGLLTCTTGVSGSGKSSLIMDTLLPAARVQLHRAAATVQGEVEGLDAVTRVVSVDQTPLGRTPRSNTATYTGLFGQLRELFASLPDARARGYKASRFSFNVKGGRCEACRGDGVVRIEMHFLPDVFVECEQCAGRRYNRETLEVRYRGYNIADVLDMQVDEARSFFEAIPKIRQRLDTLSEVGLGYLELGRSATTLSGGEAQRVKLARELDRGHREPTLYVLDEPTTGLHFVDVELLVAVLDRLVDAGHTVVVIEHHLDVLKRADHVVDLGPEGGSEGGRLVVEGTPEAVADCEQSHTGRYLRRVLEP